MSLPYLLDCEGRTKQIDNGSVFKMTKIEMKKLRGRPNQRKLGVRYVYFQRISKKKETPELNFK